MAYVDELPAVGETVLGRRYEEHPGGKGANQAVAASLWGAKTYFAGCLGDDPPGQILRTALKNAGVDLSLMQQHEAGSGLAMDFVDQAGRYQAVVTPRANLHLTPRILPDVPLFWEHIGLVVQQLEVPLLTIEELGQLAKRYEVPVLLNAAPAQKFPEHWWDWIQILVVNEVEAEQLTGETIRSLEEAQEALAKLRDKCPCVVITLGAQGVLLAHDSEIRHFPGHSVPVVSTLGAGDAFVGAFAAEWVQHQDLMRAAELANCAAAASVQRSGAQVSYVRPSDLAEFGVV